MARHTLSELARFAGAALQGDGSFEVEGTASLAEARPRDISFCAHERHERDLRSTAAGAVVVTPGLASSRSGLHLLVHEDPSAAFTEICGRFAAERARPEPGVHATAVVDSSARLGADVSIGAFSSVGPRVTLGDGVALHAGVRLGTGVRVGAGTEIQPNVVLYEGVEVGERCLIHAGCVLGADGFGFAPPAELGGTWRKIPHSGRVVLEDEVELGANCTVDRARFGITRLARGVKLDDLVHVGHNVVIGEGAMIAAQAGMSGSVRIGKGVQMGGQVGVGGHLTVGDGAQLGGQTGVIGNIEPGAIVFGCPPLPPRQFFKQQAQLGRLGKLVARVRDLEAKLEALEARAASPSQEQQETT